jgi:hypothetical protein
MTNPEHVLQMFFEHRFQMQRLQQGDLNALPREIYAALLASSSGSFRHVLLTVGMNFFLMSRWLGRKYYPNPLFFNNLMQKRVRLYLRFFLWRPFVDRAYLEAIYGQSVHMKIKHRKLPFDAFIDAFGRGVSIQRRGDPTTRVSLDFSWKMVYGPYRHIRFCHDRRLLLVIGQDGTISLWSFDENLAYVHFYGTHTNPNAIESIESKEILGKTIFAVIRRSNSGRTGDVEIHEITPDFRIVSVQLKNMHNFDSSTSYPLEGFSMIFAKINDMDLILYGTRFGIVSCWQIGDHPPRKLFDQNVHVYQHSNEVRAITYIPGRDCFKSVSINWKQVVQTLTWRLFIKPNGQVGIKFEK